MLAVGQTMAIKIYAHERNHQQTTQWSCGPSSGPYFWGCWATLIHRHFAALERKLQESLGLQPDPIYRRWNEYRNARK